MTEWGVPDLQGVWKHATVMPFERPARLGTQQSYTEEEAIGQNLDLIIPKKYHKRHHDGMERVLMGGEKRAIGHIIEMEGQKKDKTIFPVNRSMG